MANDPERAQQDEQPDLQINQVAGPPAGHGSASLMTMVQRLVMGGVGTVSMTLDEINGLVQRLVGRSENAEADVTKLVQEYVDQRTANGGIDLTPEGKISPELQAAEARSTTSLVPLHKEHGAIERSVETILVRLNVPTRTDIEELSHKISLLNDKVTRLRELRQVEASERKEPSAKQATADSDTPRMQAHRNENGQRE